MIDEVHIRDVALIHEATFTPSSAFTVVTGETGTGKTALLNALKILVGERAGASFVREGCEELQVKDAEKTAWWLHVASARKGAAAYLSTVRLLQ